MRVVGVEKRTIYRGSGDSFVIGIPKTLMEAIRRVNKQDKYEVTVEILENGDLLIRTSKLLEVAKE